jgi:hypothetical protein
VYKRQANVVRPDYDARDWPLGDQNATSHLSGEKQKTLDSVVSSGFDGSTYGGQTWGIIIVRDGKIV